MIAAIAASLHIRKGKKGEGFHQKASMFNVYQDLMDQREAEKRYFCLEVHGKRLRLARDSCGVFRASFPTMHSIRYSCVWVTEWRWFEQIVLALIGLNSLVLLLPVAYDPLHASQSMRDFLTACNLVTMLVFSLECGLKVIARGLVCSNAPESSYLRDPLNWLDLFVVLSSWLELSVFNAESSKAFVLVRTLRVLRPLRTIHALPHLRMIVAALMDSTMLMGHWLTLIGFFFTVFAIAGNNVFSTLYWQRCRLTPAPVTVNGTTMWPIDHSQQHFCGQAQCAPTPSGQPTWCASPVDPIKGVVSNYDPWYEVTQERMADYGLTGFQTYWAAILTVFQVSTMEGWSRLLYRYQDGYSDVAALLFLGIIVLFGGLILMNMVLAILWNRFDNSMHLDQPIRVEVTHNGEAIPDHILEMRLHDLVRTVDDQEREHRSHDKVHESTTGSLGIQSICLQISNSRHFQNTMLVVIIINSGIMAADHYPPFDPQVLEILDALNLVFSGVYIIEVLIKLVGRGIDFFGDHFNVFDLMLAIGSVVEWFTSGEAVVSALRTARLLRVFKMIESNVSVRVLLQVFSKAMTPTYNFCILVLLLVYTLSLLGLQLFYPRDGMATPILLNFDDILWSFISVFSLVVGEDWFRQMITMLEVQDDGQRFTILSYYLASYILGHLILMNLLVGIFVASFAHARDEMLKDYRHRLFKLMYTQEPKEEINPVFAEERMETHPEVQSPRWPQDLQQHRVHYVWLAPAALEVSDGPSKSTPTTRREAVPEVYLGGEGSGKRRREKTRALDMNFLRMVQVKQASAIRRWKLGESVKFRSEIEAHIAGRRQHGTKFEKPILEDDMENMKSQEPPTPQASVALDDTEAPFRPPVLPLAQAAHQALPPPTPRLTLGPTLLSQHRRPSFRELVHRARGSPLDDDCAMLGGTADAAKLLPRAPAAPPEPEVEGRSPATCRSACRPSFRELVQRARASPLDDDCAMLGGTDATKLLPRAPTAPPEPEAEGRSPATCRSACRPCDGDEWPSWEVGDGTCDIEQEMALPVRPSVASGVPAAVDAFGSCRSRLPPVLSRRLLRWEPAVDAEAERCAPRMMLADEWHMVPPAEDTVVDVGSPGGDAASASAPTLGSGPSPTSAASGGVTFAPSITGGAVGLTGSIASMDYPSSSASMAAARTVPSMQVRQKQSTVAQVSEAAQLYRKGQAAGRTEAFQSPAEEVPTVAPTIWINIVASPAFDPFILGMIIVSCIALALDSPYRKSDGKVALLLSLIDKLAVLVFTLEMIIRMAAFGIFRASNNLPRGSPPPYFRVGWNWIDFIAVVTGILNFIFSVAATGESSLKLVRTIRVLRVVRPLRLLKNSKGIRIIVEALLRSLPAIGNLVIIAALIYLGFGILFVNLVKGELYYCSIDPTGELRPDIETHAQCEAQGGDWLNRQSHFDHIGMSLVTLSHVSTGEGWMDVLGYLVDSRGVDKTPRRHSRVVLAIPLIMFVAISNFFVLNLFVGVLVDHYVTTKAEMVKTDLLGWEAKRWVEMQRAVFLSPKNLAHIKDKEGPMASRWRRILKIVVQSDTFDGAMLLCILGNTAVLCLAHPTQSSSFRAGLQLSSFIFVMIFNVEAALKITAHLKEYFRDAWNILDFVVAIGSDVSLVADAVSGGDGWFTQALYTFRIGRVIRLARYVKFLLLMVRTLRNVLVGLVNVTALLALIIFMYACLGMGIFGTVADGDHTGQDANFHTFGMSMLCLFRGATGERWHDIMYDLAANQPNCTDNPQTPEELDAEGPRGCGTAFAYPFFISFEIIVLVVVMKLVVAVILDGFSTVNQVAEMALYRKQVDQLVEAWRSRDNPWTGFLYWETVLDLLTTIPPPVGFQGSKRKNVIHHMRYLRLYEGKRLHIRDVMILSASRSYLWMRGDPEKDIEQVTFEQETLVEWCAQFPEVPAEDSLKDEYMAHVIVGKYVAEHVRRVKERKELELLKRMQEEQEARRTGLRARMSDQGRGAGGMPAFNPAIFQRPPPRIPPPPPPPAPLPTAVPVVPPTIGSISSLITSAGSRVSNRVSARMHGGGMPADTGAGVGDLGTAEDKTQPQQPLLRGDVAAAATAASPRTGSARGTRGRVAPQGLPPAPRAPRAASPPPAPTEDALPPELLQWDPQAAASPSILLPHRGLQAPKETQHLSPLPWPPPLSSGQGGQ